MKIWHGSTLEDNIYPVGVEPDDSSDLGQQEKDAARKQTLKAKANLAQ